MCHLTFHHFLPPKFHFSYSLLIPWTLFLFFPQFLCCCGRNLGIALILYHCKLMLLFFFPNVAFLQKTLFSNPTVCGLPSTRLALISPLALFSHDLVSYFMKNFIKLWKNCSVLSYSLLYLTILIPIFQSDCFALTSSPSISFSSYISPPTSETFFCFIQPQKWGPLEKQLFLHLLLPVLALSARMYHIKYYILSKWYLDVILVLHL